MQETRSGKAAELRQQAGNIRTMAQQISLNEPRNKMLDDAKGLEVRAGEEERRAASGPEPEPEPEPEP